MKGNIDNQTVPSLLTVKQFSTKYPAFSESSLRWIIFNEKHNGFSEAIIRCGRRIFIKDQVFFSCMEKNDEKI